jgi:uncharacterized protein YkwD
MKKLIFIALLSFAIGATAQDSENKIFLELVNAHRANHGLKPVEYSAILDSATTLHVNWMVAADTLTHIEYSVTSGEDYYYNPIDRVKKVDRNWEAHFKKVTSDGGTIKTSINIFENAGAHYQTSSNLKSLTQIKVDRSIIVLIFEQWVNSKEGHNEALLNPAVNVAAFDITGGYNEKTHRFAAYANCLIAVKL